MVELCERGRAKDESTCRQRLKELLEKKNESISRELRRRALEETRSDVPEGITAEGCGVLAPRCFRSGRGGSLIVMAVQQSARAGTSSSSLEFLKQMPSLN